MPGDKDFTKKPREVVTIENNPLYVVYRKGEQKDLPAELLIIGDIVIEPVSGRNVKVTSISGGVGNPTILIGEVVGPQEKHNG